MPLAKSLLLPLELIAAGLATDAAIQNKTYVSGMTTLIISNNEKKDIMEIVKAKSLEESGLLIKSVVETIENEANEQKRWISWYISRYIRYQFLANLLAGEKIVQAAEGMIRTVQDF